MLHIADGVVLADRIAIIDFVCPLAKTRINWILSNNIKTLTSFSKPDPKKSITM